MRRAFAAGAVLLAALAARADLKVVDAEDVVHLVGGGEVRGTVLAVGLKAVVLLVEEKEKIIPREQVLRIERGEPRQSVKLYATGAVEGVKVVTGPAAPTAAGAAAGEDKASGGAGKGPGQGKEGPRLTKEFIEDLVRKNPELARIVKSIGGTDKALEWLEKNKSRPEVNKAIEELLKTGKLPALPLGALLK